MVNNIFFFLDSSISVSNVNLSMVTCIEILHSLIEGCYSNSVESLPTVVKNTIVISSVGMCQEICHHENSAMFAVKVGITKI